MHKGLCYLSIFNASYNHFIQCLPSAILPDSISKARTYTAFILSSPTLSFIFTCISLHPLELLVLGRLGGEACRKLRILGYSGSKRPAKGHNHFALTPSSQGPHTRTHTLKRPIVAERTRRVWHDPFADKKRQSKPRPTLYASSPWTCRPAAPFHAPTLTLEETRCVYARVP